MHPPHLPPKSCSVPFYKKLRLVESILFMTVLSFISGLVGGIVSTVYIIPEYDVNTGLIRGQRVVTKTVAESAPDPLFVREQYRRVLSLVPKTLYDNTGYVPLDATVSAVLLTDTGWFVAPLPAGGVQATQWVAVTSDGEEHLIKTVVVDGARGLFYGLLDGSGFRVVTFPGLDALDAGTDVWLATHGTLDRSTLVYPTISKEIEKTYSPGEPAYTFSLSNSVLPGTVVWTSDGKFFGFVNSMGGITPWYVIQSVYTNVFTDKVLVRNVLPVHGHVVSLPESESARVGGRYGFYIERVDPRAQMIKKGDAIVQLEGNPLVPWTLEARILLHQGDQIPVTVLRDSDLIEMQLDV